MSDWPPMTWGSGDKSPPLVTLGQAGREFLPACFRPEDVGAELLTMWIPTAGSTEALPGHGPLSCRYTPGCAMCGSDVQWLP